MNGTCWNREKAFSVEIHLSWGVFDQILSASNLAATLKQRQEKRDCPKIGKYDNINQSIGFARFV